MVGEKKRWLVHDERKRGLFFYTIWFASEWVQSCLSAFQAEKLVLLENDEELPDHIKKEIPQELLDMEQNEPKRMFNPLLELKGFIPAILFYQKFKI